MFNKEINNSSNLKEAETIIGSTVKVKGNFYGQGNIIIEGVVEGSVKTTNHLFIANKAKILANVEAKNANIGGKVNGNLKISGYLELTSSAIINGNIETTELSVEKGAIINGKCSMGKQNSQHISENKQ